MSDEPLLSARAITKSFLGMKALDRVDFTLHAGEVHALLGENGAGKSTLIKVLTGAYRRDGGEIRLDGRPIDPKDVTDAQELGIGTVYQEVNLLPNLTVAENLFLGREPRRFGLVDARAMNRRSREILREYGLGIDPSALLASFSVAVRQIVAIARAVDLSGKVLILDEPTASLDAAEVDTLFEIVRSLRDRGLGIVFITHFFDQVFRIADRVTVLRNGQLVGTRPIDALKRIDLVSMMLGRELSEEESHRAPSAEGEGGAPLVRFTNYGKRGHVEPFDLTIRRGEVVGVAGLLGSGRTETAELLFGIEQPDSGTAELDGEKLTLASPRQAIAHGFGFCPEDRKLDGIVDDLSVRENIVLALQARQGWAKPLPRAEQEAIADRYIQALDIRTTDREKPVKFLSGGNQQKVILARWLATNPRFLILDEPTRGIDVGAHAEIIRLIEKLCAEGMSLLVISSELEELVVYSNRVLVLSDRRHIAELSGEAVTTSAVMKAIAAHDPEEAAA
ncbi:galactofuranose ABC transporter, ATP-binding protein YtfR [Aurantimonas sp. VKM B-3413]|uniref:galactofuranose ABC transporter, ATP-binding protein YtfR n=1 Tax=Aurantimonas sp. VKM B-3413 TaxID=2779401 RepID=UPI001E64EE51|nr:galactofuranose ABC transporter, ATP-binding protein YtfR [Aurantimonas sp. VKM B-3413]MCB8839120.1 sugar ABC transporter ATP-binding protein [Aurantimonas sp. VKM B-3413]